MSRVMKIPMPKWQAEESDEEEEEEQQQQAVGAVCRAPAYPHRAGSGFIPREAVDFGDGGAFPEIHVAQYPLGLGKKGQANDPGNQVALRVGGDGKVDYGSIAKQGKNRDMVVFTRHEDMVEKEEVDFERPTDEDEAKTVEKTKAGLEALLNGRVERSRPSQALARPNKDPTFIKYTPSQGHMNQNSGANHRIIRMVEVQQDPLEPPKFMRKKVPGQSDEAPVPVLHSPPRKASRADMEAWKIPPCMSNWKNSKGYTRPLDKLVAADGRGIADAAISDNFAKVTEALFIAERVAREEVDQRAQIAKMQATKMKEHKEQDLRAMAQQLLDERTRSVQMEAEASSEEDSDAELEEEEARARDEIRAERRREMERERRLEAAGKKTKMARDADRDISEKLALGLATKTGGDDQMYDQRLFNQEQGMSAGFGADDNYDIYDKPLMKGSSANMLASHRAKNDDEMHGGEGADEAYDKLLKTDRFRPDKGFEGTQDGRKRSRDEPVQFEREEVEADPFGLDAFLTDAKKGKKAMDGVGTSKGGGMAAAAGGSMAGGSSGRDRLEFAK